jgi:hypothetical protein
MPTKRRPLDRPRRAVVDAECIRLFRRGLALQDTYERCTFGLEPCGKTVHCLACSEFLEIGAELTRRLGLSIWRDSVFSAESDVTPPGRTVEQHEAVRELRRQLDAALLEAETAA